LSSQFIDAGYRRRRSSHLVMLPHPKQVAPRYVAGVTPLGGMQQRPRRVMVS
jgi:hypothetical protein